MIEKFGIGIDIVDIGRFEKTDFFKKTSFYKNLFLPSEIKFCLKYKNPYPHFAGKFAVKEALKKSINEQIKFLDIITLHSDSKPIVKIKNKGYSDYRFLVSISHEKNFAVAVVLSEKIS